MPSRRARLFLGYCLAFLAGVQTTVIALDVVLRHTTPIWHTPSHHLRELPPTDA